MHGKDEKERVDEGDEIPGERYPRFEIAVPWLVEPRAEEFAAREEIIDRIATRFTQRPACRTVMLL